MRALIACPRRLLLVNLATRDIDILEDHRPEYYGISWTPDGQHLVLSHSGIDMGAIHSMEDYAASERGTLSIGHRQTEHVISAPHQLLCTDHYILATNTGRNCITLLRPDDLFYQHRWLEPSKWDRMGREVYSGSHFNSVTLANDRLYIVAHNYDKPSYVLVLSWPDLKPLERIQTTARGAHNLWPMEDGRLLLCDSMRGTLIDARTNQILWSTGRKNSMTRGLASDGQTLLVGHSMESAREGRADSHGGIYVVNLHTWQTEDFLELPHFGMVNEIRLLDTPDLCHHQHPYRGPLAADPAAWGRYHARIQQLNLLRC